MVRAFHQHQRSKGGGRSSEMLWGGRLVRGCLTIIDGEPGIGKSMIAVDLAARINSGGTMPDGEPGLPNGGGVVFYAPLDESRDALLSRLAIAGADLRRIVAIGQLPRQHAAFRSSHSGERPFIVETDLAYLERAIWRADAQLVVIDPLPGTPESTNAASTDHVLQSLNMLHQIVQRTNVFCLATRDPATIAGEKTLYSGEAFTGGEIIQQRLLAVRHPQESEYCALAHLPSLPYACQPTIKFRVRRDAQEHISIEWGSTCLIFIEEHFKHRMAQLSASQRPSRTRLEILRILNECYPDELSV